MADYRIDVVAFFECHRAFPWDVLGYGVPKYGPVHSYVASILAPHAHLIERPLLSGGASMREIGRLARYIKDAQAEGHLQQTPNSPPFVCHDIWTHCDSLYERRREDRGELAQEVLNCLRKFEFFKEFVRKRLDYLWRQDLISIPRQYLTLVDNSEKKQTNRLY